MSTIDDIAGLRLDGRTHQARVEVRHSAPTDRVQVRRFCGEVTTPQIYVVAVGRDVEFIVTEQQWVDIDALVRTAIVRMKAQERSE